MPWVKLSDSFPDDWRLSAVSTSAEAVFVRLLACSNRLLANGWLDDVVVRQQITARLLDSAAVDHAVGDLVRVGLLRAENVGGRSGWRLADEFVGWQPTREKVERDRERWRLEQQRQRDVASTQPKRRVRSARQDDAGNGRPAPQERKRRPAAGLVADFNASPHSESPAVELSKRPVS